MIIDFKTLSDKTLLTEFCKQAGYVAETTDEKGEIVPNPVSEEEFATNFLRESVANYIKTYEINHAVQEAKTSQEAIVSAKIVEARR